MPATFTGRTLHHWGNVLDISHLLPCHQHGLMWQSPHQFEQGLHGFCWEICNKVAIIIANFRFVVVVVLRLHRDCSDDQKARISSLSRSSSGSDFKDALNSLTWDNATVNGLQEITSNASHSKFCFDSDTFTGIPAAVRITDVASYKLCHCHKVCNLKKPMVHS